jgi:GntR family transcriptional regulator
MSEVGVDAIATGLNQYPRKSKQALATERLLALIDTLEVGAAIPAERRLSSELGISRPTLRAAIEELVREGLLQRRQGSGTYVAEPKIALPLTMTSFSEDMRRRGMRPGSHVLAFETTTAGAQVGQRLKLSPIDPVWRIKRLRLADDETMAIEALHVPQGLVPELTRRDLEGRSFYELLRDRYGIVVSHGMQTTEPTVTDEEESKILGVPPHSPAFLFERTTSSDKGEVVEFVRSIYRGDRYRLVAELRPPFARP